MTTMDYIRQMAQDDADERARQREEQEAAEMAYECDDDLMEAANLHWARKHGLVQGYGDPALLASVGYFDSPLPANRILIAP